MKTPRYKPFVDKSVSAVLTAVEIYNKPHFQCREETFIMLLLSSWEQLLKAKIIVENKNELKSIYAMENKIGKNGNTLSSVSPLMNRSHNPTTIGLENCLAICEQHPIDIDTACKENIILLKEIQDAAIHFLENDLYLSQKVYEIGTASLKNYSTLIQKWFGYNLAVYNFSLVPAIYQQPAAHMKNSLGSNGKKEPFKNLAEYIAVKEKELSNDPGKPFYISMRIGERYAS